MVILNHVVTATVHTCALSWSDVKYYGKARTGNRYGQVTDVGCGFAGILYDTESGSFLQHFFLFKMIFPVNKPLVFRSVH